ncbi:MAG TPA: imidazole glycerol phosphate synthase cyclase subunit [Bacteriovoracaceae bacterium]|nr:imidazole glycerol phosphate synthase cyclase subunit [Bacteriovoracaceae bacterium]
MLRHRIIPVVLIDGFSVLKTIQFDVRRNLGSPVTVARTYNTRNVDELILLDIDASKQNRSIDKFTIMDIASELFMPLTVGGGIKTVEDIQTALKMGADKVSLNSEALKNPSLISEGSRVFGRQCIVVSIDIKKDGNEYKIYSHDLKKIINIDPFEWAVKAQQMGAGELLINSVDNDGVMGGPDLELLEKFRHLVTIPIIAQGGIARPQDCVDMIHAGASAIAAASIFHFTGFTPDDCKQEIHKSGLPARLSLIQKLK